MDNKFVERANRELDKKSSFTVCMTSKGHPQVRSFPLGAEIRKRDSFGGDAIQHLAGR